MTTRRTFITTLATSVAGMALGLSKSNSAEPKQLGPDAKKWDALVDKAIGYLKTSQAEDGSWGAKQPMGITGVALTGLLRTGRVKSEDPMAAKALTYIESLINAKEGHIAGKSPVRGLQNYVTSVNLMALVEAKLQGIPMTVLANQLVEEALGTKKRINARTTAENQHLTKPS